VVDYGQVGRSGLELSRMTVGTNNFGRDVDEATSVRIIRKAIDVGINSVDTANVYTSRKSEEMIGKAIRGDRDRFETPLDEILRTLDQLVGEGKALYIACSNFKVENPMAVNDVIEELGLESMIAAHVPAGAELDREERCSRFNDGWGRHPRAGGVQREDARG
jgi:aryl-alcohol dehydrogenase-like predicted oxidoreductase